MRLSRILFGSWFTCATTACTTHPDAAAVAVVRDSAGIEIVENAADSEAIVWTVAAAPSLDIGSVTDTAQTLFQVRGAHRMGDGRIAIANGGTDEIRFFGGNGAFLDAVGRAGHGPGEFEYISWMTSCETDSLYIYDIETIRLTVLDPQGAFLRTTSLMLPDQGLPYGAASCRRGGPFLVAGWPGGAVEAGLHRPSMPVALIGLDGTPLRSLGQFPGVDRWGPTVDGRLIGTWPLPFGRQLIKAMVTDHAIIGTGDSYELSFYRPDGALVRLVRLMGSDRSVTDADIETFVEDVVRRDPVESRHAATRRTYAAIEYPSVFPPYAAILTDPGGGFWVQDFLGPTDHVTTWRRFSRTGVYEGKAALPVPFDVYEFGPDYVLGVVADDMGVEHVQLLTLSATAEND